MINWTKLKLATALAAIATIGGAGGVWSIQHALAEEHALVPLADKPQPAAVKSQKATGVSGIDDAPPVVISTSPQAGVADVDPATTELKVTFSKDMKDGSWAWAQMADDTFPHTTGKPHYLADHRTCVLPVKLQPGKTYGSFPVRTSSVTNNVSARITASPVRVKTSR